MIMLKAFFALAAFYHQPKIEQCVSMPTAASHWHHRPVTLLTVGRRRITVRCTHNVRPGKDFWDLGPVCIGDYIYGIVNKTGAGFYCEVLGVR